MRTPKIYLETSVFNFVFADDAPDEKEDTIKLFEQIKQGKFIAYTSAYVGDELNNASAEKSAKMFRLIADCGIIQLGGSDEIAFLARKYVERGIIPVKYATDALHIAAATVNNLDAIISWNFKHIVKMKTIRETELVNIEEGYKRVLINSPTEVIEND